MAIYMGIDCGTQSTKIVLLDSDKKSIIGEGSANHNLISKSNGAREQHPKWWCEALVTAYQQTIQKYNIDPKKIRAISVSGQQHGFIPLDKEGNVLYPAKLWCDTETSKENQEIIDSIGEKNIIQELGLSLTTGYTASKILWFKKNYPNLWKKLDCILLPHNYINYWLTGVKTMEYGDASGTGLFNINKRIWSNLLINKIDNSGILRKALPNINPLLFIGKIRKEISELLGLNNDTIVAQGSGDNMMSAIGTGNIYPGIITMSLGTSGTIFTYSDQPIKSSSNLIANFCSANNGWLPLICTMNVTSATNNIRRLLSLNINAFNKIIESAEIGSGGIIFLPFFNGERVPNLPTAKASIHNIDTSNLTSENLCRSVIEGTIYSLRYGLELLNQSGIKNHQIRLVGGGAKSYIWRQIVADIMDCEVICLEQQESAALGAAIQAILAEKSITQPINQSNKILQDLCNQFVKLDTTTHIHPNKENVKKYQKYYTNYINTIKNLY